MRRKKVEALVRATVSNPKTGDYRVQIKSLWGGGARAIIERCWAEVDPYKGVTGDWVWRHHIQKTCPDWTQKDALKWARKAVRDLRDADAIDNDSTSFTVYL